MHSFVLMLCHIHASFHFHHRGCHKPVLYLRTEPELLQKSFCLDDFPLQATINFIKNSWEIDNNYNEMTQMNTIVLPCDMHAWFPHLTPMKLNPTFHNNQDLNQVLELGLMGGRKLAWTWSQKNCVALGIPRKTPAYLKVYAQFHLSGMLVHHHL